MKKNIVKALILGIIIAVSAPVAGAWDLKSAASKIANAAQQAQSQKNENTSTETKTDDKGSTGGIGGLISQVAGAFGFGGDLKFEDLVGTWKYSEPAVEFKSENLLMKAGGAAASKMVVEKLEPYYKMAGCDDMTLTIAADSTFTMKLKLGEFGGTITRSDDGKQIFFNFAVLKRVNIGTMEAFITKQSNDAIQITYDVSGLLEILEKVGSLTKKSSITTATELLKQYDGLTAGFALKREK